MTFNVYDLFHLSDLVQIKMQLLIAYYISVGRWTYLDTTVQQIEFIQLTKTKVSNKFCHTPYNKNLLINFLFFFFKIEERYYTTQGFVIKFELPNRSQTM